MKIYFKSLLILCLLNLTSCHNDDDNFSEDTKLETVSSAFFVLNNINAGNQLIYLKKNKKEALEFVGSYATKGSGENLFLTSNFGVLSDPNISQDAIVYTEDHQFVMNVNNNDASFSIFKINSNSLEFVDKKNTTFEYPNAMATRNGKVYVSHLDGGIQGFRLNKEGKATPIPSANHQFDASLTPFVNVSINASATTLVVTTVRDKAFVIQLDGSGGFASITETDSESGIAPYGAAFIDDTTIAISNGFDGSVRIYAINAANKLILKSKNVSNTRGHCWLRVSDDKRFAYVTNTPQGAIYTYDLSNYSETLPLVSKSTPPPSRNSVMQGEHTLSHLYLDLVYSKDYVYAMDPLNERIDTYKVKSDGTLTLEVYKSYLDWPIVNTISGGFNGFSD